MLERESIALEVSVPETYRGLRLDQALAKCFPLHSRSRLTQWIKTRQVTVNGEHWEPKAKVLGGETIAINAMLEPQQEDVGESIPLNIVFEDDDIIILNKPANLVVHPGAGNKQGTLLNALLYHAPQLAHLPRAGIVHRLDKDTTGLMVIAKTLAAHTRLVAMLQNREIERKYYALVAQELIAGGSINEPIGRHMQHRKKMAVHQNGKPACTHYRCYKRYRGFTLLDVKLETGRTHQIRVHLSHIGYPIVGDSIYGWRYRVPAQSSSELQQILSEFKRQALHAYSLQFEHPISKEVMQWQAPIPDDFETLLLLLLPKEA